MVSNTKKAVKGISSQAIITIALGLLEIISFSIMSRLLSKEDFGLFAAVSAIVNVFYSFSEAGLGASLVQKKNLDKRFVDNVFTLSLVLGLSLSAILVLCSGLLSKLILGDGGKTALMMMSICLFMNSLSSVNMSILQRNYKFITMGVIQIVALVVSTIIAVILALNSYGFYSIIAKAITAPVLIYILSFVCAKTSYRISLDKKSIIDIFNFSGWFMCSRLLRNLSKQLDRLLMPKLLSVATLGAYSRPKEFIDHISAKINGIFDTALFPVLSTIQDDTRKLQSSLSRSVYYLNLFSTFLALAFIFNSRLLIRIFFGQDWIYLAPVFIVLSVAIVFNADGRLADCYFRSMGRTKQQFYFRVGEVISKLLGVLIGSCWGIIGVAFGVVLSESALRFAKLICIAIILDIKRQEFLSWFLYSWRPVLFVLPICLLSRILLPSSLMGDIIMTTIFVIVCAISFLVFPSIIGGAFELELYPKVKTIMLNKLRIR